MQRVSWLEDGMLDLSVCPRCNGRTELHVDTDDVSGRTRRFWFCAACEGGWDQVAGRDAVWVELPNPDYRSSLLALRPDERAWWTS